MLSTCIVSENRRPRPHGPQRQTAHWRRGAYDKPPSWFYGLHAARALEHISFSKVNMLWNIFTLKRWKKTAP